MILYLYLYDNLAGPLEMKFTTNLIRKLLLVSNSDESASFVHRHLGPVFESESNPVLEKKKQSFLSLLSGGVKGQDKSYTLVVANEVKGRISERFEVLCVSDEEFHCSVRALLMLLWRLWKSCQVCN